MSTDCLSPLENMPNMFQEQPPKPWPRKWPQKCWKLTNTTDISRCLKSNRKRCKIQLRNKKPNWTKKKVAKKCQKKMKIEKCMAVRHQLSKRSKRNKKWNRKRARRLCKQKNSH